MIEYKPIAFIGYHIKKQDKIHLDHDTVLVLRSVCKLFRDVCEPWFKTFCHIRINYDLNKLSRFLSFKYMEDDEVQYGCVPFNKLKGTKETRQGLLRHQAYTAQVVLQRHGLGL